MTSLFCDFMFSLFVHLHGSFKLKGVKQISKSVAMLKVFLNYFRSIKFIYYSYGCLKISLMQFIYNFQNLK